MPGGQIPENAKHLYIHIPKTGGSSLGKSLYGDYINHVSAKIHYLSDPIRYNRMTVFSVIRHPAECFISAINHCIGKSSRAGKQDRELGKKFMELGDNAITIADKICSSPASIVRYCGQSVVFVPQQHWLCNKDALLVPRNRLFALKEGRGYLQTSRAGGGEGEVENVSNDESDWKSLSSNSLRSIQEVYGGGIGGCMKRLWIGTVYRMFWMPLIYFVDGVEENEQCR